MLTLIFNKPGGPIVISDKISFRTRKIIKVTAEIITRSIP